MKKAKEDWIGTHCEGSNIAWTKNNTKRAYQWVKSLTSETQDRSSTIQDRSGKCLTYEQEILSRWTEYCSDLYNHESCGDNAVLDCSQPPEDDLQPILRQEAVIAVASLNGEACGSLIIYHRNLFKLAGRPWLTFPQRSVAGLFQRLNPWLIHSEERATARTVELSATSVIQTKLCCKSSWTCLKR